MTIIKPTEQFKKDFDRLASEAANKVSQLVQSQSEAAPIVISRREAKRHAKALRKKEREKK